MEQIELQPLIENYHRRISNVDLSFKRYLYSQMNQKMNHSEIFFQKNCESACQLDFFLYLCPAILQNNNNKKHDVLRSREEKRDLWHLRQKQY